MHYIIYLDVFLMINLLMNFVLLFATARFAQIQVKLWRILLGSLLGAAYSLLVFTPGFTEFTGFGWKIIFSILMVITVFSPITWNKLLRVVVYFYLVAFVAGGATLAISYFVDFPHVLDTGIQMLGQGPVRWWSLVLGGSVLFVLGKMLWSFYYTTINQHNQFSFTITLQEQTIRLYGLVDTGNHLTDPLSRFPVIVVEYDNIKSLFSQDLAAVFEQFEKMEDLTSIIDSESQDEWLSRLRLIPYSSVGKSKGMLLGFRPDEVVINYNEQLIRVRQVIIGVSNRRLTVDGNYNALLHPSLIIAT